MSATNLLSTTARTILHAPDAKKAYNETLFTEVAPRYQFVTKALSFGRDRHWKRMLIDNLPAAEAPFCVDLACGTGDLTILLAERYPAGQVVGLDLTESMLAIARERCSAPQVEFRQRDMCATELADACADFVTGGYALRNAPDLGVALDEIRRILKPGGVAAFLDFSKPANALLGKMEFHFLNFWGGFWGAVLHRNPKVYGYIAESLRAFPDRCTLGTMLQSSGLRPVYNRKLFLGILELTVVRKDPA